MRMTSSIMFWIGTNQIVESRIDRVVLIPSERHAPQHLSSKLKQPEMNHVELPAA
jgi:hypothetical protein